MATEDVYDEVKELKAYQKLAEGMAVKFHQKFPLLDGIVLMNKGNDIFTDLGEGKVDLNRRLIVFREEIIKHPITGKVMGADNIIIGKASINQVLPDMSKAELISGKSEDIHHHRVVGYIVIHDPNGVSVSQPDPCGHHLPMNQPVIYAVHHDF